MNDQEIQLTKSQGLVSLMQAEIDLGKETGKINWARLFELVMQFLPLILTFFKPKDDQPETK